MLMMDFFYDKIIIYLFLLYIKLIIIINKYIDHYIFNIKTNHNCLMKYQSKSNK